jgi:hypothetical protein
VAYLAELQFHRAFKQIRRGPEGRLAARAGRIGVGTGAAVPECENRLLALGPRHHVGSAEAGCLLHETRDYVVTAHYTAALL